MLEAMFSGRWAIQTDKKGAYFIDRDPTYFGVILNFLRDPSIDISLDQNQMKLLRKEAEYYGLSEAMFPASLNQVQSQEEIKGSGWILELDTENCGSDLSFLSNLSVSKIKNDSLWSMAITKNPVPMGGRFYWEITTTNNYITFGVTTSFLRYVG
jgi:hypothetical protein